MSEIIYDGAEKLLYFYDCELFLVNYQKGSLKRLSFQDFIREIDTCPDESINWKRKMIVQYAEKVGILRNE